MTDSSGKVSLKRPQRKCSSSPYIDMSANSQTRLKRKSQASASKPVNENDLDWEEGIRSEGSAANNIDSKTRKKIDSSGSRKSASATVSGRSRKKITSTELSASTSPKLIKKASQVTTSAQTPIHRTIAALRTRRVVTNSGRYANGNSEDDGSDSADGSKAEAQKVTSNNRVTTMKKPHVVEDERMDKMLPNEDTSPVGRHESISLAHDSITNRDILNTVAVDDRVAMDILAQEDMCPVTLPESGPAQEQVQVEDSFKHGIRAMPKEQGQEAPDADTTVYAEDSVHVSKKQTDLISASQQNFALQLTRSMQCMPAGLSPVTPQTRITQSQEVITQKKSSQSSASLARKSDRLFTEDRGQRTPIIAFSSRGPRNQGVISPSKQNDTMMHRRRPIDQISRPSLGSNKLERITADVVANPPLDWERQHQEEDDESYFTNFVNLENENPAAASQGENGQSPKASQSSRVDDAGRPRLPSAEVYKNRPSTQSSLRNTEQARLPDSQQPVPSKSQSQSKAVQIAVQEPLLTKSKMPPKRRNSGIGDMASDLHPNAESEIKTNAFRIPFAPKNPNVLAPAAVSNTSKHQVMTVLPPAAKENGPGTTHTVPQLRQPPATPARTYAADKQPPLVTPASFHTVIRKSMNNKSRTGQVNKRSIAAQDEDVTVVERNIQATEPPPPAYSRRRTSSSTSSESSDPEEESTPRRLCEHSSANVTDMDNWRSVQKGSHRDIRDVLKALTDVSQTPPLQLIELTFGRTFFADFKLKKKPLVRKWSCIEMVGEASSKNSRALL